MTTPAEQEVKMTECPTCEGCGMVAVDDPIFAAEGQAAQSKAFWGVWSQAIEVVSAQSAAWDEAGKKHFYSGVADEIVALLKKEGRLRALTTASPVTAPHEPPTIDVCVRCCTVRHVAAPHSHSGKES